MNPTRGVHGPLNSALAAEMRAERARKVPPLSLRVLAESSGVPYRSLVRYVNDERSITMAVIELVARGLDVDPGELVAAAAARMHGNLPEPPLDGVPGEESAPGDVNRHKAV